MSFIYLAIVFKLPKKSFDIRKDFQKRGRKQFHGDRHTNMANTSSIEHLLSMIPWFVYALIRAFISFSNDKGTVSRSYKIVPNLHVIKNCLVLLVKCFSHCLVRKLDSQECCSIRGHCSSHGWSHTWEECLESVPRI